MGKASEYLNNLGMEHYTRLDKQEIEVILARFDIHDFSSFELLNGGAENTNYLVHSMDKKYVLCVCEQKSEAQAKELADLLKHLELNGFNTSKVVKGVDSESIIMWKAKPVMLRVFLDGKVQKELSPNVLRLIGKELARLHLIPAPSYLPKALNYGKEQFANVRVYAANSAFDNWLTEVLNYMQPHFKLELPKSFVHSDVFWDNIVISEDEDSVTIMDFEESANYYRVFDIGMTIIGICGEGKEVNLEKAKHFLAGYQSEIELTAQEKASLKAFTIYAGASMAFWRHQNFNHLKPDPKMFNHYLGLKVLVDYLLKSSDDCYGLNRKM